MSKNDNIFQTKQIYSLVNWDNSDKEEHTKIGCSLLNDNGFLITYQIRSKDKDSSYWYNKLTFYCAMTRMPVLVSVINTVIEDIKNDNFGKERGLQSRNSEVYFPTKKSDGKLYIGCKLVSTKETKKEETFLFPTKVTEGMSEGLIQLKAMRDAIKNTFDRTSSSYSQQIKEYLEIKNNSEKSKKDNSSSNSSRKSSGHPF